MFKIMLLKRLIFNLSFLTTLTFSYSIITAQTTRNVCTLTEFTSAITASASGDIININCNIVLGNSEIALSAKTITINGNNYEVSVPRPGLDDMGRFNSSPSNFRVFNLSNSSNITINNLTIKGGEANSNGGAILVNSGTNLNINNSVVSNTSTNNGGGGIAISGTMFMKNSFVRRNAALYGGGILVTGTGGAYIEESTMVENRSTSTGGGGGAAECQSGSILYFNNSTLSNNQSTEIGGAINNYQGTVYFINSSATGNVAFGSFEGGAIGNNSGSVFIMNSLFAHNYRRTTGSVSSPTGYVLDDFQRSPSGIRVYNSIYHANLPSGLDVNTGNIQYTGSADGSNNSIFSGGLLSKITDNSGNEIGDAVYRPFLYNNQGSVAPTLKSGSFVSQSGNRGVQTRFSNNNNSNPAIAYFDGTDWINLLGTSASNQLVTTDQVGTSRGSNPARGAIEGEITETLYIVKVNNSSGGNGSINGGTIYGDVYPSGSSVTLTAVPNSGFSFTRWDFVSGGTGTASTANPYTFTVTQNVTLVPVFTALSAGQYTITYVGNGHTAGSIPTGGTFSTSQTLSNSGTMLRDGFKFTGWNTNSNGSGTSYAAGATYSTTTNLTLYAQWQEILWRGGTSTDFNTSSNWNTSEVPSNTSFAIAHDATRNLILDRNLQVNFVRFYNTDKHVELGIFNLQVSNIINAGATRHFKTTGTGQLRINLEPNIAQIFPVGNSAYNPISIINKNTNSDMFGVRVLDEVYQNGTTGSVLSTIPRIRRTWDISKTNANSGGVDFTFHWNSGEAHNLTTGFRLYHYGTSWDKQSGTPTVSGNSITYTGYTGTFSPFAIGSDATPLPVELSHFSAACQNNNVELSWSTAEELNNAYFTIKESADGKSWTSLAQIPSLGNAFHTQSYTWETASANRAMFFELSQTDMDGQEKILSQRMVNCNSNATQGLNLQVYPNPNNGSFTIAINQNDEVAFEVLDVLGQTITSGSVNEQTTIQNLAKGLYFVKVIFNGQTWTEKIIVH